MDLVAETSISDVIGALSLAARALPIARAGARRLNPSSGPTVRFLQRDSELQRVIKQALDGLGEGGFDDEVREARVRQLLLSPEISSVFRQLFAFSLVDDPGVSVEDIRREFKQLMCLHLGGCSREEEETIEALFDELAVAAERTLALAMRGDAIEAHEALESARYRALLDQVRSLHLNLDFLRKLTEPDIPAFLEFESKYRLQVEQRFKFISPPSFDQQQRIPISDLYVESGFMPASARPSHSPHQLEAVRMEHFLSTAFRVVVLGNPGAGKSTFTARISYELSRASDSELFCGINLTPIHITLREFGAEKKKSNCSILDYINITSSSTHQLAPPDGAFEYLLRNGRALVIFDGLDELLDTSSRQAISGDIEAFCNRYPATAVLVTSRFVGYHEAPLDDDIFTVWHLAEFDVDQVREYANKWFSISYGNDTAQSASATDSFMRDSRVVPDLRRNALMLALICNIYRGENYIPKNRPDVYEKCALMMFDRWDRSRDIRVSLPFEVHVMPAMQYVAWWIYQDASLQGGVTELQLREKTSEYLLTSRYEDRDEAASAARSFVQFCTGRAWVFADTGTTASGERIFQFTHRTFLEYFAALWLVRTADTPEILAEHLIPRIKLGEWDVVAQLAFQIQAKGREGAPDRLIEALLEEAKQSNPSEALQLQLFAARCLRFLVPTPSLVRRCSESLLTLALDPRWDFGRTKSRSPWAAQEGPPALLALSELQESNDDVRGVVAESLGSVLTRHIRSRSVIRASAASQALLSFAALNHGLRPTSRRYWRAVHRKLLSELQPNVIALAAKVPVLASTLLFDEKISLDQFVKWHGVGSLFVQKRTRGLIREAPTPALAAIALASFSARGTRGFEPDSTLAALGEVLLREPTPWVQAGGRDAASMIWNGLPFYVSRAAGRSSAGFDLARVSPNAMFGYLAIVCTYWEVGSQALQTDDAGQRTRGPRSVSRRHLPPPLQAILGARRGDSPVERLRIELAQWRLKRNHISLLTAWAAGKLSFAELTSPIPKGALPRPMEQYWRPLFAP